MTSLLSAWRGTRRTEAIEAPIHHLSEAALTTPATTTTETKPPPAWYKDGIIPHCKRVQPQQHHEHIEGDLAEMRARGAKAKTIEAAQRALVLSYMDQHFERIDLSAALRPTFLEPRSGARMPKLIVVRMGCLTDICRTCVLQTPTMSIGRVTPKSIHWTADPSEMELADLTGLGTDNLRLLAKPGYNNGYQATLTWTVEGGVPDEAQAPFCRLGLNGGGTTADTGNTVTGAGSEVVEALRSVDATGLMLAPAPEKGPEVRIGDPVGVVTCVIDGVRYAWRITGYFDLLPV
jgi:hypothetical protein